jgi:dTDP-glucose 4,6-dehydratase
MYLDTNVIGTLNVLQAARELGVSKLVHTSTSEVYGTAKYVPIDEDHPLQGQSPYSATKIGADQLVFSFYASFNLPAITIRPFNTYGPRQSARAIIPSVISQISSGGKVVKVGSTTPTRDFTYVTDTVEGFIAALESPIGFGEVFNIGSNFEVSISETIELISEMMKSEIIIEEDSARIRPLKSEVDRLWADNSKAAEILNWRPKVGGKEGFKLGLQKTIDWFADTKNQSHYKTGLYNI